MKDALNNGLIKAMREHLPEETNLANYIIVSESGDFSGPDRRDQPGGRSRF